MPSDDARNTTIGLALLLLLGSPAYPTEQASVYLQSGDVSPHSAVVWARCNNEPTGRVIFDLSTFKDFRDTDTDATRTQLETKVGAESDYTGADQFNGLEPGTTYYYRAQCVVSAESGEGQKDTGPVGRFKTAPKQDHAAALSFIWAADLAGQGWGQNPAVQITDHDGDTITGGYVIFEVMKKLEPDFAVFQGDMIYADNRIPPTKTIPAKLGGGIWVNQPSKDLVAITLDQYRDNWKYNWLDTKLRDFLRLTPIYAQWDDHEVTNNWYPGEILSSGAPYKGLSADVLAERARQAMFEYHPIAGKLIYRRFQHGKHMELFLLDERSFRGPNSENYDPNGIEMLGATQFQWLKVALKRSAATWKVISTHDPLSIVTGIPTDRDAWAQGEPQVLGREVQLAELLSFVKNEDIQNVVFLTSDVHFAAAIRYDPARASYTDFNPFWEFVIGPTHAGAFGPGALDASFGPSYEFLRASGTEGHPVQNLPPPNLQSFGSVTVGQEGSLTVRIHDITGAVLYERRMMP